MVQQWQWYGQDSLHPPSKDEDDDTAWLSQRTANILTHFPIASALDLHPMHTRVPPPCMHCVCVWCVCMCGVCCVCVCTWCVVCYAGIKISHVCTYVLMLWGGRRWGYVTRLQRCVYMVCCVLCSVHVMLLCDNNQKCCVQTCCPAFGSHLVLLNALHMCSVVTMVI